MKIYIDSDEFYPYYYETSFTNNVYEVEFTEEEYKTVLYADII